MFPIIPEGILKTGRIIYNIKKAWGACSFKTITHTHHGSTFHKITKKILGNHCSRIVSFSFRQFYTKYLESFHCVFACSHVMLPYFETWTRKKCNGLTHTHFYSSFFFTNYFLRIVLCCSKSFSSHFAVCWQK